LSKGSVLCAYTGWNLNAEVVILNSLSSHADQNGLLEFISGCQPLKKVFLVHGDVEQTQALFDFLKQKGINNAYMPYQNEEIELP
jgi:metallo-beta-lactamase family protein